MNKTSFVTAAASLAIVLMTGSAFAKSFEAVYDVSIHAHPNKLSKSVDRLFEGEVVKVRTCDGDWCLISHPGPDGWVPMASLERAGGYDQGGYDQGPTIIIQGGGGFDFPHKPKPPVIVDPGPHKPPFGQITNVGNLPVKANPIMNGGNGGGTVNPPNGGLGGGGTVVCKIGKPCIKPF